MTVREEHLISASRETKRDHAAVDRRVQSARARTLAQLDEALEMPMVFLGFVWLALLVADLLGKLSSGWEILSNVIWVFFIIESFVKFLLAPQKLLFLKGHWLTILSLVLPAFRILRIGAALRAARAARVTRGLRLVRLLTSLNRGMRLLGTILGRRGFGYVLSLTVVVALAGAAGMHALENDPASGGDFRSFGGALWWTAMMMTTMGSGEWPVTPEGRILCVVLALYAFGVFGYVTAALASVFIEADADRKSRRSALPEGDEEPPPRQ